MHFWRVCIGLVIVGSIGFLFLGKHLADELKQEYNSRSSARLLDRQGEMIRLVPNAEGYFAEYLDDWPVEVTNVLLKQEDRYFYWHLGVNPFSMLRAAYRTAFGLANPASSTIQQQLAKILLHQELDRSIKNKFVETVYALSLEMFSSKEEMLRMYLNSVYLGESAQGMSAAARLYFGSPLTALNTEQVEALVQTIPGPSERNPFALARKGEADALLSVREVSDRKQQFKYWTQSDSSFELGEHWQNCPGDCALTLDAHLTESIRSIVLAELQKLYAKQATHGGVVVIKVPENEILALVGSPNPREFSGGYQLNMALEPRPIGSTIKPLLYLKAFLQNLRPYTRVVDREYKYLIGSGFEFYPKNYDLQYRGEVNLHYALSNSLNVPAVKVLEYIGIDQFNSFLTDTLRFRPVQDLRNYQLGIALGQLEMDLLTLGYYFTLFPNHGVLKPLTISQNHQSLAFDGQTDFNQRQKIAHPAFIQMISKILSDRETGMEQFGMKSQLNLFDSEVALKTGTSRDYHDSWVMIYTPDLVVGVWVGNARNAPMDAVSGQQGAGNIWHGVMNLLLNSEYHSNKKFNFDGLQEYRSGPELEYGLPGDDYEKYRNLMADEGLILTPHDGDVFRFEEGMSIKLQAREELEWDVGGRGVGRGQEIWWVPEGAGSYEIGGGGKVVKIVIE